MEDFGIKPLGTRVVVSAVAVEEAQSKGGILLPGGTQTSTVKAEIVAVGDEVSLVEIDDLVLVSIGAGDTVEHESALYVILDEVEILATLTRS